MGELDTCALFTNDDQKALCQLS